MLKLTWQPAPAPPPLLNIMRREENKWVYIYTWAAGLFFHHIYNVRIELALSGVSFCFAIYLAFLLPSIPLHPSALSLSLSLSLSLHVSLLSVVRKNYLKD